MSTITLLPELPLTTSVLDKSMNTLERRAGAGQISSSAPDRTRERLLAANERWRAVLAVDGQNEIALQQLASNFLVLDDCGSCADTLEGLAVIQKPSNPQRTCELRARYHAMQSEHDAAIGCWLKAVEHGYHAGNGNLNIANLLLASGDYRSAREYIRAASEFPECRERIAICTARCDMRELRWSDAIARLENLGQFSRHRTAAATLLFQCYLSDSRHDSATALCQLLQDEDNPQFHHLNGKLLYRTFQYGKAIDSFAESVNLTDHVESKVWLVKSLYAVNDNDNAIAQANLLQLTNSSDYLTQGNCWMAAGKLSMAEQRYKKAVRIQKDYAAYSALVNFYFNNRNWGKAYYTLKRAKHLGIESNAFANLEATMLSAFSAAGITPPRNIVKLSRFEFYSSEAMVTALVDRLLANKGTAEPQEIPKTNRKVALIIGSLGPGGAERQVVNLANGLVESSEIGSVNLLCTHLSRKHQDRHYESQVHPKVITSEYYRRDELLTPESIPELAPYSEMLQHIQPASRLQVILHLARALVDIKPDVVHGWLDETMINTSLVCSMLGIENIVGRWGSMPPGVNRQVSEKDQSNVEYLQHAYREILRLPGIKYTSNSRLTANAYSDMMNMAEENVRVVYNGIDENALVADACVVDGIRSDLGIPTESKVVGTVFRISEEKRPHLWMDVARQLQEIDPGMHFIMVGTGPMEALIAEYVDEIGLKNIHMVGKQTQVGPWYDLFDVLLLTSRVEGVSNVVIESQHSGCPVVAPNVGGLSEAMLDDSTGYLLDDHSVESFAGAVCRIIDNDSQRIAFAERARDFARSKFSIEGMIVNYQSVFFSH
ncbi:MAG: glycosyltransferase [Granulosicoccus sp.]|nr:glycosyltransferase [Granulosicoccus sp.]